MRTKKGKKVSFSKHKIKRKKHYLTPDFSFIPCKLSALHIYMYNVTCRPAGYLVDYIWGRSIDPTQLKNVKIYIVN